MKIRIWIFHLGFLVMQKIKYPLLLKALPDIQNLPDLRFFFFSFRWDMEGELYKLFPHVGQEGTVVPSKDVGYIKFETPVFVKDFRFRFAFHDVYILLKIISYKIARITFA